MKLTRLAETEASHERGEQQMIHVRALRREDDFRDLIALSKEFFQEYEAHHEDFFKIDQLTDSSIIDYFSRSVDDENGETFIALAQTRVVGYITVYVREHAAHWKIKKVGDISGLMVHKDHRRRGIASQLIARARAYQ
jgi:GNAT superfamily N-acetyltransferase